ncbi:uncharacterized protein [Physcomitrium patens]|uniref:Uncharacterized protein n=1 Tax=Physcomitrium patens TaxID=3218 RepID=A0A2K1JU27_PHYPA|nr:hypothetical protein PHYPA_014805 [Physcomitrium patens]
MRHPSSTSLIHHFDNWHPCMPNHLLCVHVIILSFFAGPTSTFSPVSSLGEFVFLPLSSNFSQASLPLLLLREPGERNQVFKMVDAAALIIGVILFVILSPGLLLQIPGDDRPIEITNQRTSIASVIVHAVVFIILFYLLQLIFHVNGGTKTD